MVCKVVHVMEDSNDNLLHVISEIDSSSATSHTSQKPTAFVHTGHGVESVSTGSSKLRGNLRHRYSGMYEGSKSSYARSVDANTKTASSNDEIVARSGLKNVRKGSGAVVLLGSLLTAGSVGLGAVQLVNLWNACSSDGFWSGAEMARFGIESSELLFNPVGSSATEVFRAVTNPDVDLMSAAEIPSGAERVVDHVFNNGDAYGSAASEAVGGGVGELLGNIAGLFFG